MMKKLLVLLSVLAVGSAFADQTTGSQGAKDDGTQDLGFYGEVQAGVGNSSALNSGGDAAGAGRFDLGYKFSPYMAVEGGITGLANPSAGATLAPLQFYDVSFKGILPISKYFDLHAQAGLAYAYMSAPTVNGTLSGAGSDATLKGMVGAGFDVYLTNSFAIVVNDYNYLGADAGSTSGAGGNTNVVMGGIKYNF